MTWSMCILMSQNKANKDYWGLRYILTFYLKATTYSLKFSKTFNLKL